MTNNLSIHIGLNRVDPDKYDGWDGALRGCINDANAMRAIAKRQGFTTLRLTDQEATRASVIKAVAKAADTLACQVTRSCSPIPVMAARYLIRITTSPTAKTRPGFCLTAC